jgi:hypothetical protein
MAGLTSQLAVDSDTKSQDVEEITHPAVKPQSAVVYSTTYALPGKVGYCIPQISIDRNYAQRLQYLIACEPWVITQLVNYVAGSIVITYQSGVMSDSDMRLYLASLIQSAGNVEVTMPVTQKLVSSPSVEQRTGHTDVTQEHRDETPTPISSAPELQRVRFEDSQSQKGNEICQSEGQAPLTSSLCLTLQNSFHHDSQTHPKAKQLATEACSIAHAIPGRVRFHVPRIAKDSKYVQRLETLLKADSAVTGERINSAAASIVITYKSGAIPNSQKRSMSLVEQAISYLSSLIQSAASETVVPVR